MSCKPSRVSNPSGAYERPGIAKRLLAFAAGFLIISCPPMFRAQTAPAGTKSAPSASELQPATVTPMAPQPDEYQISPRDVLDIYVYDVPELSRTYEVSPSGAVTMPLLDQPVQAAGLTAEQFAHVLEEAFRQSGRLRRPEIAVSVKQTRKSSVVVDGAVRTPQVLQVMDRTRLVDILSQCGGAADDAGDRLTITRGPMALHELAAEGGQAAPTLSLDLKKVLDGNDPASLTTVWPGDRVSVERAGIFYILGEVRSPGGYSLRGAQSDITVLRALALAGDASVTAKKSKAMIIRKDPKAANGREEIALNLKEILLGRSPDPKLQANDILYVPASGGKRALHTLTTVPGAVVGSAATAAIVVH